MKKIYFLWSLLGLLTLQLGWAQTNISGTVNDETGAPLPGATVIVEGSTRGVATDFDGNFSIQAIQGDVLVITYVGYADQRITVGSDDSYNISLNPQGELEEIVVIGYGQQFQSRIIQNISTVKQESIENLQVISADQLLQGQTSGVQVVNSSGVLGAASVIRVRGTNSINSGSQPLVVIDGVPITDTDNTFLRGGNTGINPLSYINPNDIESFTVLKDAGATSIYGARGANGVIIINTKKGRKNSPAVVTLDTNIQFTNATDVPDILTADEFRQFKSEVASIQQGMTVTPEDLNLGTIGTPGTDWLGGVQQTGITANYNLGIQGGSEKTTYYFGLDYQDAENFIIGNTLKKISARLNIATDVNNWLRAGMNLSYTNTNILRVSVENSINAPFTTAFLQSPVVRAYDDDGNFAQSGSFIPNIFARVALDSDDLKTTRIIGNAFTEITFAKGLKWKSEIGVDQLQFEEFLRAAEFNTPGGSADQLIVHENRWLTNQLLTYTNTFNERHAVDITLGLNYEETLRTRLNVNGTGFLTDDLRNLGSAATVSVSNGDRDPTRLYGVFSRVSYNFNEKYLIEGSFRRDGSSRFGSNNRFGNFWSVAGGWILSSEEFMQGTDFIDYFALRASYGTVGNDRLGTFPSLALFSAGSDGDYNGNSGIIPDPTQPENPNLKWEESSTFDIGFKSSFLDNKLNVNLNYFKRVTDDLLLNQVLPPQTGFNTISLNVGELQNTGWELDIESTNISTEDFTWNTRFNVSFIKNRLNRLNEDAATDPDGNRIIAGTSQRAIEGQSLNNFYLIRYVGVNPQTGHAEWLDQNGDSTLNPSSGDRVVVGSPLPDFSGGLTNTFKYGNFDLSILANYSVGNDIFIDGLRFADGNDAIGGIVNIRRQNLNFWRQSGDNAFLPNPTSETFNRFNQRSDLQLFDGSYFRLKNITLGYSFPKNMVDSTKIFKGIRLYATTTNVFTIKGSDLKGIDPEVTDDIDPRFQGESFFTAPQSQSYLFGARLNF